MDGISFSSQDFILQVESDWVTFNRLLITTPQLLFMNHGLLNDDMALSAEAVKKLFGDQQNWDSTQ